MAIPMKRVRMRKQRGKPPLGAFTGMTAVFFCGFLAGIFAVNLQNHARSEAAALLAFGCFGAPKQREFETLRELLPRRSAFAVLLALSAVTIFGTVFAVLTAAALGVFVGGLLTLGLLEFGLRGGIFFAGFLFPQYVCYLPALLLLCEIVFRISKKSAKTLQVPLAELRKHGLTILLLLFFYGIGIVFEGYLHPAAARFLGGRLGFL